MTDRFLLDLNVLIALSWPQHIHHTRAHDWFASLMGQWATTPFTEAGYLRLTLNPLVVGRPVSLPAALTALTTMRALPGHTFVPDASSLADPLVSMGRVATTRQITDVHLVNLAATTGWTLATLDKGIAEMLEPSDRNHVLVLPQR